MNLGAGEQLIREGKAIFLADSTATGGCLILTDMRLFFVANFVGNRNPAWESALEEVTAVARTQLFRLFPICIAVSSIYEDRPIRFVVADCAGWIRGIKTAIASAPKPPTWSKILIPSSARTTLDADAYIREHGAFPLPDRSGVPRNFSLANGAIDLGWSSGVIGDGRHERPFFAETWAAEGHVTNLTMFFSRIGLEELTAEQFLDQLRHNGLIEGVPAIPCELLRIEDASGHPLWSVNICLGADHTVYVSRSLPCLPYAR